MISLILQRWSLYAALPQIQTERWGDSRNLGAVKFLRNTKEDWHETSKESLDFTSFSMVWGASFVPCRYLRAAPIPRVRRHAQDLDGRRQYWMRAAQQCVGLSEISVLTGPTTFAHSCHSWTALLFYAVLFLPESSSLRSAAVALVSNPPKPKALNLSRNADGFPYANAGMWRKNTRWTKRSVPMKYGLLALPLVKGAKCRTGSTAGVQAACICATPQIE